MFHAKIRLYNPEYYVGGRMYVNPDDLEWLSLPYLEPEQCGHEESMCRGCRDTWEVDYEVVTPTLV